MTWSLILRPGAEDDLREAQSWYNSQRSGLGDQLLDEVGYALQLLAEDPERRPFYYNGFRRCLVRRFPYKIFYRIEGDRIVVFRILHAKRDHRRHL